MYTVLAWIWDGTSKWKTHAKGRVCPADSETRATRAPKLAMIRILTVTMAHERVVVCVMSGETSVSARRVRREETETPDNDHVQ